VETTAGEATIPADQQEEQASGLAEKVEAPADFPADWVEAPVPAGYLAERVGVVEGSDFLRLAFRFVNL
jgi:hypothetical protein